MNTHWSSLVYTTFVMGALAVYLLMPRAGRSTNIAGTLIGMVALALAMFLCADMFVGTSSGNALFYASAVIALASAVKVITDEKPVYSALYFVLTVLAITPLLILQHAEFLAIALVIIYAGAILVTYVFVIMLAQQGGRPACDHRARQPLLAVVGGFLTMAVIAGQMATLPDEQAVIVAAAPAPTSDAPLAEPDNTMQVGSVMLTQYVVAFELAGVLLLVAMIGAIAMSQKRIPSEKLVEPTKPPGQIGREVGPY